MKHKNIPQDLTIRYKVQTYNVIDQLFDIKDGEMPGFHLLLSLMGYISGSKIPLNTEDSREGKQREFSIRTVYPRNESDLDTYYGLIAILDNLDRNYDEVIDTIAFERTGTNGRPFLKMTNVKTFYEYMLGGIDFFEKTFLKDGHDAYRVAMNIHSYLNKVESDIDEILVDMISEEGLEL